MRRFALALFLTWATSSSSQIFGQDFWYAPPGLDYGYQSGIDLGNGLGFGYGIGFGFNGNRGSSTAPVFQPDFDQQQFASSPAASMAKLALVPFVDKATRLEASRAKQKGMELRRAAAREQAKSRNERYFAYLEDHPSAK